MSAARFTPKEQTLFFSYNGGTGPLSQFPILAYIFMMLLMTIGHQVT